MEDPVLTPGDSPVTDEPPAKLPPVLAPQLSFVQPQWHVSTPSGSSSGEPLAEHLQAAAAASASVVADKPADSAAAAAVAAEPVSLGVPLPSEKPQHGFQTPERPTSPRIGLGLASGSLAHGHSHGHGAPGSAGGAGAGSAAAAGGATASASPGRLPAQLGTPASGFRRTSTLVGVGDVQWSRSRPTRPSFLVRSIMLRSSFSSLTILALCRVLPCPAAACLTSQS